MGKRTKTKACLISLRTFRCLQTSGEAITSDKVDGSEISHATAVGAFASCVD